MACSKCATLQHWACMGLPAPPSWPLPSPLCVACLQAEQLPLTACSGAAVARALAEASALRQGRTVWPAAPDGGCLVNCVAEAVEPRMDRMELLRRALGIIEGSLDLGGLSEAECKATRREATQLRRLATRNLEQRMATLWDSSLWDHMPRALSRAVGRPLYIYAGSLSSGQAGRTIVDETAGVQGAPIALLLRVPLRPLRSGTVSGLARKPQRGAQGARPGATCRTVQEKCMHPFAQGALWRTRTRGLARLATACKTANRYRSEHRFERRGRPPCAGR
jgi:hypothetical protein